MPTYEFSTRAQNEIIYFSVDGDTFECVPILPAAALSDVALSTTGNSGEQMKAIMQFLDFALTEESNERFALRMRDKTRPIDLGTLTEVFGKLVEAYGSNNPTGGSNGSRSGSKAVGPRSTAGAGRARSTPSP